jgi:predicted SprT family Zn-dependent metalloprotease
VGRSGVGMATTHNPFVEKMIAVREEALQLLNEHGLYEQGWHFQFSNHKTIVGQCDYRAKVIKFSTNFLMKNDEDFITDTLLHEIAHALVGKDVQAHGYEWRMKARAIGCNGERTCGPEAQSTARHNYYMECPRCFKRWYRYKMLRRNHGSRCPHCHVEVKIYKIIRR